MPSLTPLRGVRMEDELYLKLKYTAKKYNRSFNQEAVYIFKCYIENFEKENGTIHVDTDELYK